VSSLNFLNRLETVIDQRIESRAEDSYSARLASLGALKVAQKIGEEGVEVALAGACEDDTRLIEESSDLIFHLLLLLRVRKLSIQDVCTELERRHAA
jgi:phosphoribosyl-ATP pyrophosphohydrolase/phosphoribosyl-AMP cyclohydrolase